MTTPDADPPLGASTVAVVHEWIASRAGSEKVFERLAQVFPSADLFALSREPDVPMHVADRVIRTTVLDNRLTRRRRGATLPLMPLAWQLRGPRRAYDVVMTSHHAFASSNRLAARSGSHFCYVHSPARYVWSPELDQRGASAWVRPARTVLKRVDRHAAARITDVAANSATVAERIGRYWDREARVIYPPVDTEFFTPAGRLDEPSPSLLGFGRWIPYKRLDLVIRLGAEAGLPVVIAGHGPGARELRQIGAAAGVPVTFVERPSQERVRELYRRASALIFPTEEDFGLVPVEAMACGTPVVALGRGGAAETVQDGLTGALVPSVDVRDLRRGLDVALGAAPADCRARAEFFSQERFDERIVDWVSASLG
jgi:glycosyltransferase involved in cell wall biosynthesis